MKTNIAMADHAAAQLPRNLTAVPIKGKRQRNIASTGEPSRGKRRQLRPNASEPTEGSAEIPKKRIVLKTPTIFTSPSNASPPDQTPRASMRPKHLQNPAEAVDPSKKPHDDVIDISDSDDDSEEDVSDSGKSLTHANRSPAAVLAISPRKHARSDISRHKDTNDDFKTVKANATPLPSNPTLLEHIGGAHQEGQSLGHEDSTSNLKGPPISHDTNEVEGHGSPSEAKSEQRLELNPIARARTLLDEVGLLQSKDPMELANHLSTLKKYESELRNALTGSIAVKSVTQSGKTIIARKSARISSRSNAQGEGGQGQGYSQSSQDASASPTPTATTRSRTKNKKMRPVAPNSSGNSHKSASQSSSLLHQRSGSHAKHIQEYNRNEEDIKEKGHEESDQDFPDPEDCWQPNFRESLAGSSISTHNDPSGNGDYASRSSSVDLPKLSNSFSQDHKNFRHKPESKDGRAQHASPVVGSDTRSSTPMPFVTTVDPSSSHFHGHAASMMMQPWELKTGVIQNEFGEGKLFFGAVLFLASRWDTVCLLYP